MSNARGRVRPPPPPFPLSTSEITQLLSLLLNLSISSHASQALVSATFGRAFGPMSFHFATVISILLFSILDYAPEARQRQFLELVSVLQIILATLGSSAAALIAQRVDNPTLGALLVHLGLSLPILGCGGGIWLQWASKLLDPEPTLIGSLLTKVITCVALGMVINFLEPLIGTVAYQWTTLSLSTCALAMFTYGYSKIALHDEKRGHMLGAAKTISINSLFTLLIAFCTSRSTPEDLHVLYQHFTPSGLLVVADYRGTVPPVRYLRHDASIVGVSEIIGAAAPNALVDKKGAVYRMSIVEAMNDVVRLAQTSEAGDALILGFKSGLITNSLIEHGYNTTVVEPDRYLYAIAQTFFVKNRPFPPYHSVHLEEPTRWLWNTFSKNASSQANNVKKFDIIIHDLIRGGEMPAQFYTMEIWEALNALMGEKGVIAVNYLGFPGSISFKSLANMLSNVFSTCRAFHSNTFDEPPLSQTNKLTRVVFFCASSAKLTFQRPSGSDYAVSWGIRHEIFESLAQREIDLAETLKGIPRNRYLLRDADPRVKSWGKESINEHWKQMRSWFPVDVWNTHDGF